MAGPKGRRRAPPPPRLCRSSQGRRKKREPCRLGREGVMEAGQGQLYTHTHTGDPARPPPARRPEVRAP